MKRVLVLHPKSSEPDEVEMLGSRLANHVDLHKAFPTEPLWEVTTARSSFMAFEKKYGTPVNWRRWFDLVTGNTAPFGLAEPTFHVFIVAPESVVGKATKDIVEMALRKGRVVLRLTPDQTLEKVTKVVAIDPQNFKRGWVVA